MSKNCNCAVQMGFVASWFCPVHGRLNKKPTTDPGPLRPIIADPVPTKGKLRPNVVDGNEVCPGCEAVITRSGSGWKCLSCGETEGCT